MTRSARRTLSSACACVLSLVLAIVSCDDGEMSLTSPDDPADAPAARPAVSDGAHAGNADFFFLPPVVADPSGGESFDEGSFNPDLLPVLSLTICLLEDTDQDDVPDTCVADGGQPGGNGPLTFTASGSDAGAIRLDAESEHYIVAWHSDDADFPTADGDVFRATVGVGSSELGFVDLEIVDKNGGKGKNKKTGEEFAMKDGRTVPVKFRIEDGALCRAAGEPTLDCDDSAAEVVGPGGGTVITNTGFAGVEVPEGAVDEPVLITIARRDLEEGERCLPTGLVQAEGCYRFDTDPDISEVVDDGEDQFNVPVTVGVCLADPTEARRERFTLHKFDPENPGDGVVELDEAQALFIDCTNFALLDAERGRLGELAHAGWEQVAKPALSWLGPSALSAADVGFGGTTLQFSRIGWAEAASLSIAGGDGQTGVAGATLTSPLVVQVEATHPDPDEPAGSGVDVTFEVASGGGQLSFGSSSGSRIVVPTDANGRASVNLELGSDVETDTVEAFVAGPTGGFVSAGPTTFAATRAEPAAITVDGILSEGEWAGATTFEVNSVPLPDESTTTATVLVTNDATDLFVAVRFDRDMSEFFTHTVAFRLDENPVDGSWNAGGDGNGDDDFVIQHKDAFGERVDQLIDGFFASFVDPPQGQSDVAHDGQNHGETAIVNDTGDVGEASTVIEGSHPLDSGDFRDAVLASGDPFGLRVTTFVETSNGSSVSVDLVAPWASLTVR